MIKKIVIAFLFLVCNIALFAQKKYSLKIVVADSSVTKNFKLPDYQKKFDTRTQARQEVQQMLLNLYDLSYLSASADSIVQDSSLLTAYITLGQPYKWAYLNKGNVDEGILSQTGYREKIYFHKPFYYKTVHKLMDKILVFYEDHGYPFAQIKMDTVSLGPDNISAALMIKKERVEKIDSIVIKGDLKLVPQYFYSYLGIRPGDLYDESKVRAISARLKALTFLYETKPLQVIFVEDKVKILLYISKRSANQFDGIIGILPGTTGQIVLTGDVSLQLLNSFHHAEEIGFHWQHIQAQTENLTLHFSYPYFFTTPLGADADLKLFKQDTTYLQVDTKVGLKYMLTGGNYWEAFYENISSSLLSTSQLEFITTLPPYADETTDLYGIEYKATSVDNILNPRRGYELLVNGAVGNKNIHINSRLNPVIYDSLKLNSTEYRLNLNSAYFIPLFNRSAIKLAEVAGYINAPSLLLNDLYRIGGFNLLRGFNEQSIYASEFSVTTIEYHYLLEQNSYLFLFFDQGWYKQNTEIPGYNAQDMPYGFGAGMSFQTKAGIFSIDYALGSQFANPISFKAGKINFGIVSNF